MFETGAQTKQSGVSLITITTSGRYEAQQIAILMNLQNTAINYSNMAVKKQSVQGFEAEEDSGLC